MIGPVGDRTHFTTPTHRDRLSPHTALPAHPALVEAQEWVFGSKGEEILTASAPTVTPQMLSLKPAACQGKYYTLRVKHLS